MSRAVEVTVAIIVVLIVLVAVRAARAQTLPAFHRVDATDEARLAGFVKAFLASDAQARQLLNRSCLAFLISIIAAEDRPLINACLSSHAMLA